MITGLPPCGILSHAGYRLVSVKRRHQQETEVHREGVVGVYLSTSFSASILLWQWLYPSKKTPTPFQHPVSAHGFSFLWTLVTLFPVYPWYLGLTLVSSCINCGHISVAISSLKTPYLNHLHEFCFLLGLQLIQVEYYSFDHYLLYIIYWIKSLILCICVYFLLRFISHSEFQYILQVSC